MSNCLVTYIVVYVSMCMACSSLPVAYGFHVAGRLRSGLVWSVSFWRS